MVHQVNAQLQLTCGLLPACYVGIRFHFFFLFFGFGGGSSFTAFSNSPPTASACRMRYSLVFQPDINLDLPVLGSVYEELGSRLGDLPVRVTGNASVTSLLRGIASK